MKAILFYPFNEQKIDEIDIGQSVYQSLIDHGCDIKRISMYNADGSYKDSAKDVYDVIQNGFNAQFVLAMDYGPWKGIGWNKLNFPNTLLVYEAGDEPQSMYSHLPKLMSSDLILTPDARNYSIYKDAFKKNCIWWPQFLMKSYMNKYDIQISPICVTSCGEDRGETTRYMKSTLQDSFQNKRIWASHDEHAKFLSTGAIVFQESKHREITRRLMEAAALGRLVLADRPSKGTCYDELFEENKEIIWYDCKEEAVEKAKYYLSHLKECQQIGENAKKRAIKDHTVDVRVQQLLITISGLLNK